MHLLHRVRSKYDQVEVTVRTALASLEIVALRRLDRTQTRAAALTVHDKTRQFRTCHIAERFAHQTDTGARRRSHHTFTGRSSTINHIGGCNLRLCLQHDHTGRFPGFLLHKRLHNLRLRSDRIAEVAVATVANRSMSDHFVAFHQFYFFLCHSLFKFLTINRDATVRTDNRAGRTSCAGIRVSHLSHGVTFAVYLGR